VSSPVTTTTRTTTNRTVTSTTAIGGPSMGPGASGMPVTPRLPRAAARRTALHAGIGHLDGLAEHSVAWFRGPVTAEDAPVVAQVIRGGIAAGVPIVGIIERMGLPGDAGVNDAASGAPVLASYVDALDGWGAITRALADASGVVPTVLVLDGPCLGGAALAVGLVDIVVMTNRSSLYLNGPEASSRMTGTETLEPGHLGNTRAHLTYSGIADVAAGDTDEAIATVADVLSFLPPNNLDPPPAVFSVDPLDRSRAGSLVPADGHVSYDVRDVVCDLVDDAWFLELRAPYGTSLVVGLARIAGLPVGVVASQPSQLAGALDIDSSVKGARFVRWCDAFNLPLVTLIDTPGFRPGRDQEWRGIVRHGAKLAFAYAEATVPRVSVVLRKSYGGAYIVMDCKAMGTDCALAWPQAEIAVMGAPGAVEILHRRRLSQLSEHERLPARAALEAAYAAEHLSPRRAAERGLIDAVIEPAMTRRTLAEALTALTAKREPPIRRRHENIPL
jgi:acetyl-CoA carboxylase carboxyltransferase component